MWADKFGIPWMVNSPAEICEHGRDRLDDALSRDALLSLILRERCRVEPR